MDIEPRGRRMSLRENIRKRIENTMDRMTKRVLKAFDEGKNISIKPIKPWRKTSESMDILPGDVVYIIYIEKKSS
jgi:ribosomal protein L21E